MNDNTLTCVYCGQAYPPGTPTHGAPVLTNHILICPKHPLAKVRKALVGLVGVDTKEELLQMRGIMSMIPDSDPNKKVSQDAIQALLETMPE